MIKVILFFQDNTVENDETPHEIMYVKDDKEFWEKYNSSNEYVRCDDYVNSFRDTYSVYLKKDKIIEIWIEKAVEDKE